MEKSSGAGEFDGCKEGSPYGFHTLGQSSLSGRRGRFEKVIGHSSYI